jgi:hypothetical protein
LGASNRARSITVKGRKRKDSAGENVEAHRHETETRKNVVWTGKAENTSFEVPTVSLHIHKRISP